MKKHLKNERGETIVEVLVSFVLLLLFTAMFVVSLRYARAMSRKAETLRETAYTFCSELYPLRDGQPTWNTDGGEQSMTFGSNEFSISGVQLESTDTTAQVTENGTTTTQTHTFHRYSLAANGTQGGTDGS